MKFLRFKPILFILTIVFININLYAQGFQDSVLKTEKRLPILNGFRFMTSEIVGDPFINTNFYLNLGSGAALDLKSNIRNLNGDTIRTVSGDLTYMTGKVQFQYAWNDWLALNASFFGYGRLGSNAYTILSAGISYSTGYVLGGKIKILQTNKSFLSGSVDYSSSDVFLYSIYDYVKQVYETGYVDSTSSLLQKEKIYNTFFNIRYAYAPTDYLGLAAVGGFGVGKVFQQEQRGKVRLGVSASVDFLNVDLIHFPIGVVGSVRYNSFPESGEDVSNLFTYGFRLCYTGHKDFDIGIESTYQSLKYVKMDQKIQTVLTEFKVLYYF